MTSSSYCTTVLAVMSTTFREVLRGNDLLLSLVLPLCHQQFHILSESPLWQPCLWNQFLCVFVFYVIRKIGSQQSHIIRACSKNEATALPICSAIPVPLCWILSLALLMSLSVLHLQTPYEQGGCDHPGQSRSDTEH